MGDIIDDLFKRGGDALQYAVAEGIMSVNDLGVHRLWHLLHTMPGAAIQTYVREMRGAGLPVVLPVMGRWEAINSTVNHTVIDRLAGVADRMYINLHVPASRDPLILASGLQGDIRQRSFVHVREVHLDSTAPDYVYAVTHIGKLSGILQVGHFPSLQKAVVYINVNNADVNGAVIITNEHIEWVFKLTGDVGDRAIVITFSPCVFKFPLTVDARELPPNAKVSVQRSQLRKPTNALDVDLTFMRSSQSQTLEVPIAFHSAAIRPENGIYQKRYTSTTPAVQTLVYDP